ncbi:hypothetical protein CBR_g20302 [Chara braunii]|uniref:Calcineurin-like phosphoesterase domain-containing protein n=1 Tax=Chara braunii TaxID=69332 RepID=A0A388L053_CHABU|nr:hypothetical protein CBR_g20302 [Chara braunii]|eukprot:GBG75675.1 hypothetical protein CBR_g20302 [Chara braunii]
MNLPGEQDAERGKQDGVEGSGTVETSTEGTGGVEKGQEGGEGRSVLAAPGSISSSSSTRRTIVCVGDLHGQIDKVLALWANLESYLGKERFLRCTVIFLGDYCDRNPRVKELLDWLIALPRRYPDQRHVFLMGNHDFAMAALLGLLREPKGGEGKGFSATWRDYAHNEAKEGWWTGEGVEGIHLQGRRWGGVMRTRYNPKGVEYMGSIYDSAPTFASYGVEHGDREAFINAVPESHKLFLRNLCWVHEEEGIDTGDPATSFKRLIAVHAGLEKMKPVAEQLRLLREKDSSIARLEQFNGRASVWETPEELAQEGAVVVSGHHGRLYIGRHRIVVDESGGRRHLPLTALVLPERVVVKDRGIDRTEEAAPAARDNTQLGLSSATSGIAPCAPRGGHVSCGPLTAAGKPPTGSVGLGSPKVAGSGLSASRSLPPTASPSCLPTPPLAAVAKSGSGSAGGSDSDSEHDAPRESSSSISSVLPSSNTLPAPS